MPNLYDTYAVQDVSAAATLFTALSSSTVLGIQRVVTTVSYRATQSGAEYEAGMREDTQLEIEDAMKIASLIERFRHRGHLCAKLDPLQRVQRGPWMSEAPNHTQRGSERCLVELLDGYPYGSSLADRARYVAEKLQLANGGDALRKYYVTRLRSGDAPQYWNLAEIVERMAQCYCETLSIEAEHLSTQEQVDWISDRFENRRRLRPMTQRQLLQTLIDADQFERFLAEKFPATKRFGLEGCEAVLSAVKDVIEQCSFYGVEKVEIGIAHRGRLNVLCNILGKPFGALCNELAGFRSEFQVGDVLYHLGQSGELRCLAGDGATRAVRLFVAPNPSHLEFINPVILGMVRAEQKLLKDTERKRVMGLLIHGDASFSGLGIVAETLQLSDAEGFRTGGVIHIVINNQIGFTTIPAYGRSGLHATDVVKMIGAPVLHANADDPESVYQACLIAAEWREVFKKDVVIDVVGYRRHGHNERDNPEAFLPLTYERVNQHPRVQSIYAAKLIREGVVTPAEVMDWTSAKRAEYEQEWRWFEEGKYKESAEQFLSSNWQGAALQELYQEGRGPPEMFHQEPTGLPIETLQFVGKKICKIPEAFIVHEHYQQIFENRLKMVKDPKSRVNWGMAEALAFGTLVLHRWKRGRNSMGITEPDASLGLNEGHYHVRLSGQDVERGTFNHRHAVLYDQRSGARCVKLNEISLGKQDTVEIWNSPLSEAAVLGFEYGYSLGFRDSGLVIWESQFGDFANNAQVHPRPGTPARGVFIGLVLLLPHGYDGEGPDHSSARLERFLSLCNDDPDHLPGHSPDLQKQITQTFEAITRDYDRKINRQQAAELLKSIGVVSDGVDGHVNGEGEMLDLLWCEMELRENAPITEADWNNFMVQYSRRNAERHANLFIVNATTPAQFFHALRRQCNLPYKKPLVIMSPKYLHHHRPCTSALEDFATGTYFNRVIGDGKFSDNVRHHTGESFLKPPEEIRRVILCSGQIYYHLSTARRSRTARDIVLVRLEQISPFPHDLITRILSQYLLAEIVWCQEEPKNMGAWLYVRPRMETAMRELCKKLERAPRQLRQESKEILDAAMTLD